MLQRFRSPPIKSGFKKVENQIMSNVPNTSAVAVAAAFAAIQIEVNKKVNGKYEKIGEQTIHVPTLHAIFPNLVIATDKDGNEVIEDGLPVYTDDKANYVQGSILAAVKAQARNKLVDGKVKAGQVIASNWEELLAEGERVGNPDALAAIREAKAAFAQYVVSLGKSEGAQNTLTTLFASKQALGLQDQKNKDKMAKYVEEFAITLDEAQMNRFMKYLESVSKACEPSVEIDDF